MPKHPKTPEEIAARERLMREVGERLHLVCEVLRLSQTEFAQRAGMTSNHYNQIEVGKKLPSIEAAIALCDAYRIPLDWVFRGEQGDMSVRLWDGIRALMKAREP